MNRRWAIFFCLAFLAVHWLNQAIGTYGLMFDESQYWFWAKHPAFGYYSKPPMIAWLMAASTALFGDGNFGVKMLSPVLLLGIGLMLRATSRLLGYNERTSNWVLVTYLTLPVVTGNAIFFTTDVPLQFCWAVAMHGVLHALLHPQKAGRWWLLAGAAAGFGLLSKYTTVAFAASSFCALVAVPGNRRWFATPWPWLAAITAVAIFAPNLWWNAQHHFATFHHTNDRVVTKQVEFYPRDMLTFIAAQWGVFGPVLLGALLLHLRYGPRNETTRLLNCYIWPLALAGVITALLAGAQAHWIAPAYLAGTLLVVPWLEAKAPRWLKASLIINIIFLVLFYLAPPVLNQLPPKKNPMTRAFVWNELETPVKEELAKHPGAIPITDERKIATALTYALRDTRGSAEPVYKWKDPGVVRDHYDLLTEQADLKGKPVLLILRDPLPAHYIGYHLVRQVTLDGYAFYMYFQPHYAGAANAS